MQHSPRKIVLFAFLIIILISSSGCIHIDFGNPFKSEEPKKTEFEIKHKEGFPIAYEFDTLTNLNIENSDTEPIAVKSSTEWVNITIKVVINDLELINTTPIANYTNFERSVLVKLLDPDNKPYYEKKFIETDEVRRQLSTPAPGAWIVTVDAVGIGYEDTKDSYWIDVFAFEPV
jgi:hypothetical protein